MINVMIKEGWAGGPWHTKQFRQAVTATGFNLTDALHADVIIAHSLACYDLPPKTPARYYILINPPYWPGESIISRFLKKQRQDSRTLHDKYGWKYAIMSGAWGLVYLLAKPKYTKMALKNSSQLDFLNQLKDKKVLVIRNERDYFCSPDIHIPLASYPHVFYRVTPGEHDDYYTNPKPYIDLIPKNL